MSGHSCEHCDEHDMVPGALAQRFKDEIAQPREALEKIERAADERIAAGIVDDEFVHWAFDVAYAALKTIRGQ